MAIVERIDPEEHGWNSYQVGLHVTRYYLATQYVHGNVLDLACGVGYGSVILAKESAAKTVLGVDKDRGAVDKAIAYVQKADVPPSKVRFLCSTAEAFAMFVGGRFDSFVCLETLEHLEDPQGFLSNMKTNRLNPGGAVVVSLPLNEKPGANPFHMHVFNEDTANKLFREFFTHETHYLQNGGYLTLVGRI